MRIGILDDRCERRSASRQVRTKGGRFRSDTGSFAIADGSATIAVSSKLAREAYEQQLGIEPVGLCPAMLPRYCATRGMDHMRLDPTRTQPTCQPEAVAAGFEGSAIHVIFSPALTASSRQRCSSPRSLSAFASSFLRG